MKLVIPGILIFVGIAAGILKFYLTAQLEEVMVPMRDGVKLHTRIWKPVEAKNGDTYPVILERGYQPGYPEHAERFTAAGYIYVGQSSRGHRLSEGELNRFFSDAKDGYDTLDWISQQPWSNGKIAMYGKSYMAATQWLVAPEQHPNLKAIIPQNMNADIWQCVYRCNGALTLAMTAHGRTYGSSEDREKIAEYGWEDFYRHLPLINLDEAFTGEKNKMWREYVSHATYDDYWQAIGIRDKYDKITIPVYLMGGWYDYYPGAAFTSFNQLKAQGATDEIRIAISPTDHLDRVVEARNFGPHADKDELGLAIRWLDYVIKGIDNGIKDEPPIKIFVMGINEWREAYEWPLPGTQFTNYYFRSPDGSRIGSLSTAPPGDEPPTVYIYDPDDPVPTIGGNHSFLGTDQPELIQVGAFDQRPNESRHDVLVFTRPPVIEDMEVTGPIVIKLYAASSAPDTDFTAKLIDVYPDGAAYNLTEGIIRARFRESIWEAPKPLVPGKIYEYTLELLPTSNVFKKGHRIRVHLTSSNFPLWDRNPNTGREQGMYTQLQIAEQTIFHEQAYPSHIILPIIPAEAN
jgi:putative CocE/NonD family hydrolase